MHEIALRFAHIQERLRAAALRADRRLEDVQVLAATKWRSANQINAAIQAGVRCIGENRVQEALPKFSALLPVQKHFIGHLQSNKAKAVVELFDCIQSVDSLKLAQLLDRHAGSVGKRLPILLGVNVAGEAAKSGVSPDQAIPLARQIVALEHVQVRGLMAMPPYTEDPEAVRPHFRTVKALYDELAALPGVEAKCLSMGTSQDFEVAVEEGATLVRL
ncbi:MAG TPA: YggS family pyridoxal phosphate-dependent enzyme, partial [Candidatus Bipolaricaulota bacterium]